MARPWLSRLMAALLALGLVTAAGVAWSRYLVRATVLQLWTHPYFFIAAVCVALAAWLWRYSGLTPARWHPAICIPVATWCVVAWEEQTSSLGRQSLASLCVGASTLWMSVCVLAVRWERRVAAAACGGAVALAVCFVAALQFDGLDGQGAAMMSVRGTGRRPLASSLPSHPQESASRLEARWYEFPGLRFDGSGAVPLNRRGAWHAPEEVWAQPVGAGWSGAVVDRHQRVYTLGEVDGRETTYCWDLESGAALWTKTRSAAFNRPLSGTGPRATPALWRDRVATLGADGQLFCRRQQDGQLLWTRNILEDAGAANTMHGAVASPLWVEGMLVVSVGGRDAAVAAYDGEHGALRWQAGDAEAGYSTPTVMTLNATTQIVVLHRAKVAGYSLNGEQLWDHDYQNNDGTNAVQPLQVGDNQVFLSSGYGREAELIELVDEAGRDGSEHTATPRVVWKSKRPQTKFSSSVIHDTHLLALDNGILCCLDLESGKTLWKGGRYGCGQLLLSGDLLLIQAENGDLAFVSPSASGWNELGRWPALQRRTWNSPCLAGHYLILRNDELAVCYMIGDGDP